MSKVPSILVLATAALLALAPLAALAAPPPGHKLDKEQRAHPLLQVGAQAEPNKKVRVVVQKELPGHSSAAIAAAAGATVEEEFSFINAVVLEVPQQAVPALARNPHVRYVSPISEVKPQDGGVDTRALQTIYPRVVNADKVWNANTDSLQATGNGVGVAVIDSGLNKNAADFKSANLTTVNVHPNARGAGDSYGHGTHVVGTIAGRADGQTYVGVAPYAKIISIKIADDTGKADVADLLRGLQWVYDNRGAYTIRVVNLSLTSSKAESYKTSPVAAAVEQLWLNGVVVVAAAGNRGPVSDALWYAPANDPYVITVGCMDDNQTAAFGDESVCSFSSRGTSQDGFAKPDVVAPGRKVYSALASKLSTLAQLFPSRISADGAHIRLSGTSMSAAVVSGVVALILERYPNLTPNQVKYLLTSTGRLYTGQPDSAKLVDAYAAMSTAAAGNVAAANQGLTPNSGISAGTNTVMWGTSYWDTSYWDTSYWDTSYWDVSTTID